MKKSEEQVIGGISFSNEELEIIAAILKYKTEKQAAKFLNVPLQDIEPLIFNIIKKINGSSIDDIFALFAAPNYLEVIGKFFLLYTVSKNFNNILKELSLLTTPNTKCFIIDSAGSDYTRSRKTVLSSILNKIGFTVTYLDSTIENLKYPEKSIILTDDEHLKNSINTSHGTPIYFTQTFANQKLNCYAENASNFYFTVLDIISLLLMNDKINAVINTFKRNCVKDANISYKPTPIEKFSRIHKSFKENSSNKITILFSVILVGIALLGKFYYNTFKNIPVILQNTAIPSQSFVLPRIGLQNALTRSIKAQENNKTKFVIILGAGGSGRTTAAKIFVNKQEGRIKWIINAETEGTLMNSLIDLLQKLSHLSNSSQKILMIKNIKITSVKKKKLASFLWKQLKTLGKYHIIFDNVENIPLVMDFIPLQDDLGDGTIYISTRDPNVSEYGFDAKHIVNVFTLREHEQIQLLTSVLYHNTIIDPTEYKQISKFLKELLPYPLDVLSAAHYIKNTGISLDEYLSRMYRLRSSFENVQNSIHKSVIGHKQTRQAIITSSVSSLIKQNILFKKLLLTLTLIDSQEIPRKVLYNKYPDEIVDDFILALQKNFIADIRKNKICMHRSVQKTSRRFLTANMDYKTIFETTATLVKSLSMLQEDYIQNQNTEDAVKLNVHIKSLLYNLKLVLKGNDPNTLKPKLYMLLGKIHFDAIANYISAVKYFNLAIEANKNHHSLSNLELAEIEQHLGWIRLYWNQFELSDTHIKNSLRLCDKTPEYNNIIRTNIRNLGKSAGIKGNLRLAMDYFNKALKMVGPLDNSFNKNAKAGILNQIASAYLRNYIHQTDKNLEAIAYLEKALILTNASKMFTLQQNPDISKISSWAAPSRWRIAQNYFMLERYEEALDNLDESDFIVNHFSHYKYRALQKLLNLRERAKIKLRQGKLDESLTTFNSAINLIKQNNIGMDTWKAQVYRAEVFMRLGEYKKAWQDISYILSHEHGQNNYSVLLYSITLLHAAIIKNLENNKIEAKSYIKKFFTIIAPLLKSETVTTNPSFSTSIKKINDHPENLSIVEGINNAIKIMEILIGKNNDFIKNHLKKYVIKTK